MGLPVQNICGAKPILSICCIINSHSGTAGRAPRQLLVELFSKHGVTPEILEPEDASSIPRLAKDAVQRGCDIIVAGGGDGTVNAVASAIVGDSTKKLGVLPIGTFNHFARDLGIPVELEDAIENIVAGNERVIDVGEVNGRIFVNNSSLGLYPAIVRLRESLQKSGFGKFPAAVWASLRIISRFRRLHLELHAEPEAPLHLTTAMLFVGNNAYEMSVNQLGTRSSVDGGKLWVMMPTATDLWALLMSLFVILAGRETAKEVLTYGASDLIVACRRRLLNVAVDGEVLQLQTPLNYRTRPNSLRVIVPATFVESHSKNSAR